MEPGPNDQSSTNDPPVVIDHDAVAQRFVTTVDGHVGYTIYVLDGDIMVIDHTVVPPAIGGRGIAGKLVRAAFEHARSQGLRVRTDCSYAAGWVARHPEFADLLA